MKILLYGYYDKGNLGDDLFKFIFKKYFDSKNISYFIINPQQLEKSINYKNNSKLFKSGSFSLDKDIQHLTNLNIIKDNIISDIDLIFIGGGEIINDYFLIPLFKYIKYNQLNNIPIFGASIGFNNTICEYVKFFDKCIFRNKVDIVDNINYFYDNDIVFGLNKFFTPKFDNIIPNTFGYYLIDDINDTKYNILKLFTLFIINKYKIRFIIFDYNKDYNIIYKLINDCNLQYHQYDIIFNNNIFELINEIVKNEKHLCIRFHSHVLCYLYKLQFISFPLTDKTIQFNNKYNINYTFNINELTSSIYTQNIIFQDVTFNFDILDSFFSQQINNNNNFKLLSIWSIFYEIYDNFINIITNKAKIINEDNKINDTDKYINYISNQIELNIIGYLHSSFKYGIDEKLYYLFYKYNDNCYLLQHEFISIMTNLYKKN